MGGALNIKATCMHVFRHHSGGTGRVRSGAGGVGGGTVEEAVDRKVVGRRSDFGSGIESSDEILHAEEVHHGLVEDGILLVQVVEAAQLGKSQKQITVHCAKGVIQKSKCGNWRSEGNKTLNNFVSNCSPMNSTWVLFIHRSLLFYSPANCRPACTEGRSCWRQTIFQWKQPNL